MPIIPRQNQRVLPGGGSIVDPGSSDPAAAIYNAGQSALKATASHLNRQAELTRIEEEKRKKLADEAFVSEAVADANIRYTERLLDVESEAQSDGSDYTSLADAAFDDVLNEIADTATNAEQSRLFRLRMQRSRESAGVKSRLTQATKAAAHHLDQLDNATQTTANYLVSNPGDLSERMLDLEDTYASLSALYGEEKANKWIEDSRSIYAYSALNGMIHQNPQQALDELESGIHDDTLTGQQKVTLLGRAGSQIEASNESAVAYVRESYSQAMTAARQGMQVNDAESIVAMLNATGKDADAQRARNLQKFINYQPVMERSASLSSLNKGRRLNEISSQLSDGVSAAESELLLAEQTLINSVMREAKSDPMAAYAKYVMQTEMPDFDDTEARQRMAIAASQWAGVPATPYTDQEAALLKQSLNGRITAQGEALALSETFGGYTQYTQRALGKQFAKSDPGLGVAIAVYGENPELSAKIVAGLRVNDIQISKENIQSALPSYFGEVYRGSPQSRQATIDAASAVYRRNMSLLGMAPATSQDFDPNVWQQSLKEVEGDREAFAINGAYFLAPVKDISAREFRATLRALTPDDLMQYGSNYNEVTGALTPLEEPPYVGGLPGFNRADVTGKDLDLEGQLIQFGDGRYRFRVGTGLVSGGDGTFVLDMRRLIEEKGIRPATIASDDPIGPDGLPKVKG